MKSITLTLLAYAVALVAASVILWSLPAGAQDAAHEPMLMTIYAADETAWTIPSDRATCLLAGVMHQDGALFIEHFPDDPNRPREKAAHVECRCVEIEAP